MPNLITVAYTTGGTSITAGGPPGSGLAPNVTSATASVDYFLDSNVSSFGFNGTITLPVSDPDYSHLKLIRVLAFGPGTNPAGVELASFAAPFTGSSITWSGGTFPMPGADQSGWSVEFKCYDESDILTTGPFTVSSLTVRGSYVTALSAGESARTVQADNRLIHSTITFTPTLNQSIVPQNVTYWLSSYDDATKWTWIGWTKYDTVGASISVDRLTPGTTKTWKVAVAPGAIGGVGGAAIATAALPSNAFISSGFTVSGYGLPSSSGVTSASIPAGPYNTTRPDDGSQYVSIPGVTYTDPTSDNNAFFVRVTVQCVDSSGNPAPANQGGTEVPFAGTQVTGGTHTTGALDLDYNPTGSAYTYMRYRIYSINRLDQTEYSFSNSSAATLQNCWTGGANHFDVNFGSIPAGTIDASRLGASTLGSSFAFTGGKLVIGSSGIVSSMIGSVNASSITGSITAGQIGSVNASSITGSITAGQIGSVNAAAISGTIVAGQIGSVNASAITGGIVAGQITSVNASAITGSIAAGQIGSVNASSISGLIAAGQINTITAGQITGTITSSQIGSVSASTITGTITSSQIGSVAASTITGTLTSSQIASVAASTITGTITSGQIGSVNASAITGTITSGQIGSVSAGTITGSITSGQIGSVSATTITGVIVSTQLANQILDSARLIASGLLGPGIVNDGTFLRVGTTDTSNMASNPDFEYGTKDWSTSGTITSSVHYTGSNSLSLTGGGQYCVNTSLYSCKPGDQFVLQSYVQAASGATGTVNNLVRFFDNSSNFISDGPWGSYNVGSTGTWNLMQTGISTAPANAAYVQIYAIWTGAATGTFYVDNVLMKRAVDSTMISSVAASTITGSITAGQIGSVNSSTLVGLITAGQINTIAATQITGALTASQISSVNASSITGGITSGQISSVNASTIVGGITSGQISSVSAGSITGTITSGQISSVTSSSIVGSISASQISSVNASSITGSISYSQIGSINAATITVNQISDSQISGISAGKITAGTITASISINSPTINGGSLNINTSVGSTVTISGSVDGVRVQSGSFFVTHRSSDIVVNGPSNHTQIYTNAVEVTDAGTFSHLGSTQIYVSGGTSTMSNTALTIAGVSCINSSGQFVGNGVNVGRFNGVGCRSVNPYDSGGSLWTGQDATVVHPGGITVNGFSYTTLKFVGGILVSWF